MRNRRDYSLAAYEELLGIILACIYRVVPFNEYQTQRDNRGRTIILRHDVDRNLARALRMAKVEKRLGVRGTYFYRRARQGFTKKEIMAVMELGHEVGYHYEDLHVAKGNLAAALESFEKNLARLREIASIKTICMHGSPLSKYDNRDMWRTRSYRDFGIIGEPYFDIDFDKVMYLTDTGRRWDGESVSIRDKADKDRKSITEGSRAEHQLRLHSTRDIINALKNNQLPDQIMLTIHPQRWTDEWVPWLWELVSQKTKNIVKSIIVKRINNKKA